MPMLRPVAARPPRAVTLLIVALTLAVATIGARGGLTAERTEVFVLGTLYKRHEVVPAYDLPALRRIVIAIKPDVLVLDCTPREIADERVHPSKVEYPSVIFPLMREGRYKVYAAEPDEPLFSEIVQSIVTAAAVFEKERPDAAAAWKRYGESTYSALTALWRSPADVHEHVTATALAGKQALDGELVGPALVNGSARWNRHWADAILKAAHENPGRRILATVGIENRAPIAKALEPEAALTVVDMARWLRGHP